MNVDDIEKLSEEEKIELLKNTIVNDNLYLRKLYILLNLDNEKGSELMEKILENKAEEERIFTKEFGIALNKTFNIDDIKNSINNQNFSDAMKIMLDDENIEFSYQRACSQVLEILQFIPDEYRCRVNENFIKKLQELANIEEPLVVREIGKFSDLKILNETKQILALINNKYWN